MVSTEKVNITEEDSRLTFKKVIVLTQYYAPESGAPQIRLANLTRVLALNGCDVRVITGFPNYPTGVIEESYRDRWSLKEEIDGIEVSRHWLYAASGRNKLKRIVNYLSFTFSVLPEVLFSKDVDLIFVEAQPVTLALPALIRKLTRGTPYIYNTPDLQVEYASEDKWMPAIVPWLARRLERFLMNRALSVTTVTHAFIKHFISELGIKPKKMSFMPNGADTTVLKPSKTDIEFRQKMGVKGKFVFTYAGTHAPYQGLETIIHAASMLIDRSDICILIVGDGPERKNIMNLAASLDLENVYFSKSPFSEMEKLMSITYASIVVLRALEISKMMRLSKTIPPLSCGVPVLFSGWGETADIIDKYEAGMVCSPEDSKQLADSIIYLADHPEVREKMSHSARQLAQKEFDWGYIVNDWVRQINNITDGKEPDIKNLDLHS